MLFHVAVRAQQLAAVKLFCHRRPRSPLVSDGPVQPTLVLAIGVSMMNAERSQTLRVTTPLARAAQVLNHATLELSALLA